MLDILLHYFGCGPAVGGQGQFPMRGQEEAPPGIGLVGVWDTLKRLFGVRSKKERSPSEQEFLDWEASEVQKRVMDYWDELQEWQKGEGYIPEWAPNWWPKTPKDYPKYEPPFGGWWLDFPVPPPVDLWKEFPETPGATEPGERQWGRKGMAAAEVTKQAVWWKSYEEWYKENVT